MPTYSFSVNANSALFSYKTFGTLAANEHIVSLTLSSEQSEDDKGYYTVPAASYGSITVALYTRPSSISSSDLIRTFRSFRKNAASSSDASTTFVPEVNKFTTTEAIKSFGTSPTITITRSSWSGSLPTSVTSFICTLTTAYAYNFSVGEFEHAYGLSTTYRQGLIPEGTTIGLSIIPDTGYKLAGWYSSQVTITNDQFTMPDYDVTVTPIIVLMYHNITIGQAEHGYATVSENVPETGTTVSLTAYPDTNYVLHHWESSPEVAITNNSFIVPDSDVTITPVFVPKNAGHYNGDYYDPCVPMYYDGSNWIECEWKHYNGSSWDNADSL